MPSASDRAAALSTLLVALTAPLACGSSTSSGGGVSGAGGAGGGSGAGGAPSCADNPTRAACETCCQALDPVGHASAVQALTQDCGCNAGAPCEAECAANVCKGGATSDACNACITGEGSAAGKACVEQVITACTTDMNCPPVVTCQQGCMSLP